MNESTKESTSIQCVYPVMKLNAESSVLIFWFVGACTNYTLLYGVSSVSGDVAG